MTESPLPAERPIPFKPELVRKILRGEKDVTRRIVMVGRGKDRKPLDRGRFYRMDGQFGWFGDEIPDDPVPLKVRCPYAAKRLWVRETWQHCRECGGYGFVGQPPEQDHGCDNCGGSKFVYRASTNDSEARKYSWNPSIHMPRRASRLILDVVSIRAEKLRDITFDDIRREGIHCPEHDFPGGFCCSECASLRLEFYRTWDAINPHAPVGMNPLVWRVEFRKVEA